MAARKGGFRRGTRQIFKKSSREKGKISHRQFFQVLSEGDRVQLMAESAYQNGMYFPRFHGKFGIVEGKQGKCYTVKIQDHNAEKTLIVHPVHLKKM
jgi:large subunit ribosomal protein L21e